MYFHNVGGTGSYTTSTTNMYKISRTIFERIARNTGTCCRPGPTKRWQNTTHCLEWPRGGKFPEHQKLKKGTVLALIVQKNLVSLSTRDPSMCRIASLVRYSQVTPRAVPNTTRSNHVATTQQPRSNHTYPCF